MGEPGSLRQPLDPWPVIYIYFFFLCPIADGGTLCGALIRRSRPKLELIGKTKPQVKAIIRDRTETLQEREVLEF